MADERAKHEIRIFKVTADDVAKLPAPPWFSVQETDDQEARAEAERTRYWTKRTGFWTFTHDGQPSYFFSTEESAVRNRIEKLLKLGQMTAFLQRGKLAPA